VDRNFRTLLITVVASAVVWLTPLASVIVLAFGGVSPIISWLVFQVIVSGSASQKRSESGATCFPNCCSSVVNAPFWCLGSCGPPGTCR
jgi:hypothetical protein